MPDKQYGSIAGGAFLKKFTADYPWVHLDIAGVAFDIQSDTAPYIPSTGATGWGTRLLVQLVEDWSN